jgi:hypothetical protein
LYFREKLSLFLKETLVKHKVNLFILLFFFWVPSFCSVIQFDEYKNPFISARNLAARIKEQKNIISVITNFKNGICSAIQERFFPDEHPVKVPNLASKPEELFQYLLMPKDEGQLWCMLDQVLTEHEKQQLPISKIYNAITKEYRVELKEAYAGKSNYLFTPAFLLQKRILEHCKLPFDLPFAQHYMNSRLPLMVPILRLIEQMRGHAFPPDIQKAVLSECAKKSKLWYIRANSLALSQVFAGHKRSVRDIWPIEQGAKIISNSEDSSIKIWDVKSGNNFITFANNRNIFSMHVNKDETLIALGDPSSGTIEIKKVATGACKQTIAAGLLIFLIRFIELDDYYLVSSDSKSIAVWDKEGNRQFVFKPEKDCNIWQIRTFFQSPLIMLITDDCPNIQIFDLNRREWLLKLSVSRGYQFVADFVDENQIFLGKDQTDDEFKVYLPQTKEIRIVNSGYEILSYLVPGIHDPCGLFHAAGKCIEYIRAPFEIDDTDVYEKLCTPLLFSIKRYLAITKKNAPDFRFGGFHEWI